MYTMLTRTYTHWTTMQLLSCHLEEFCGNRIYSDEKRDVIMHYKKKQIYSR